MGDICVLAAVGIPWHVICSLHWEVEVSLAIIGCSEVIGGACDRSCVPEEAEMRMLIWEAKMPNLVTKSLKETLSAI